MYITKEQALEKILAYVAESYNVEPEQIKLESRISDLTYPRHLYCYLANKVKINASLGLISGVIDRNHATAIHSISKCKTLIKSGKIQKSRVDKILSKIMSDNQITNLIVGQKISTVQVKRKMKKKIRKLPAVSKPAPKIKSKYDSLLKFEELECFFAQAGINASGCCKEAGITNTYLGLIMNKKRPITKGFIEKMLPVMQKYGFKIS